MHISSPKYKLGELTRANLDASARVLAEVFLAENKVWATINPSLEDTIKFMHDKASQMLDWQQELRDSGVIGKETFTNFVYMDENDNILGVWTNMELTQYLAKKSSVKLPQFDFLEHHGAELYQGIDSRDKVPGLSVYGVFVALDPLKIGAGASVNLWIDVSSYLYSQGFRVLYGRMSSARSYGFLMKAGGVMTGKKVVNEKGKELTLSFVKTMLSPHASELVVKHQQKKRRPLL